MKSTLAGILLFTLCVLCGPALFAQDAWTTDYTAALQQAQTDNKAVLLDFTGSDWCPWCIKMKRETLDSDAFLAYAKDNLELVEVDFPKLKPQSDDEKAQNQQLKEQFQVRGFPTFVIVSKDGRVLGRHVGYMQGGPDAFIALIQQVYHGPGAGN